MKEIQTTLLTQDEIIKQNNKNESKIMIKNCKKLMAHGLVVCAESDFKRMENTK